MRRAVAAFRIRMDTDESAQTVEIPRSWLDQWRNGDALLQSQNGEPPSQHQLNTTELRRLVVPLEQIAVERFYGEFGLSEIIVSLRLPRPVIGVFSFSVSSLANLRFPAAHEHRVHVSALDGSTIYRS